MSRFGARCSQQLTIMFQHTRMRHAPAVSRDAPPASCSVAEPVVTFRNPRLERSKKSPARTRGSFRCGGERQRLMPSPLTSTSTRRFGARQAISSFIAVIVQTTPGTGCVLPMPSVSILSLGTPFDTR
jgi:hypothetical protein